MSLDKYHTREIFGKSEQVTAAQGKRGGVTFTDDDIKAVIHFSKDADWSTWIHENAHIFRRQLEGDLLVQAEKAFNVKDGNWTTEQEEDFAQGLERYLQEGYAPNQELKTLFQKFADWIKKIYKSLVGKIEINPDIKAVYDSLFNKSESPLSKEYESRQTEEIKKTLDEWESENEESRKQIEERIAKTLFQAAKDNRLPTAEEIAEAKRQIEEVRKQYEGTDQWMKAPNGKPTNLNERQWLLVRTPKFKEWFGDWEAQAELQIANENVTKEQAIEYLKSLAGKDIINIETGIKARINTPQRNKIISLTALEKSQNNGFTAKQHNAAAA